GHGYTCERRQRAAGRYQSVDSLGLASRPLRGESQVRVQLGVSCFDAPVEIRQQLASGDFLRREGFFDALDGPSGSQWFLPVQVRPLQGETIGYRLDHRG